MMDRMVPRTQVDRLIGEAVDAGEAEAEERANGVADQLGECEDALTETEQALGREERRLVGAHERIVALSAAIDEATTWLEAEAAHPREDPGPAMTRLAERLRAVDDAKPADTWTEV